MLMVIGDHWCSLVDGAQRGHNGRQNRLQWLSGWNIIINLRARFEHYVDQRCRVGSWPLQLIEHFSNTTSVAPPPAGPAAKFF